MRHRLGYRDFLRLWAARLGAPFLLLLLPLDLLSLALSLQLLLSKLLFACLLLALL